MLFKKTLKVAAATALWMVALLGATSAMAQATLPTFSAEALTRDASVTAFGVNREDGFTANMVVNERLQYYLATTDRDVFARVSPSGMAFAEGKTPTLQIDTGEMQDDGTIDWTDGGSVNGTRASGGAFRYELAGLDSRASADAIRLTAEIAGDSNVAVFEAMVSAVGTAGVTIAVYDKEEDAQFGEGSVHQSATTNMFNVASSVKVASATEAPVSHTASAAAQFRQLTSGPGKKSLGGFNVTVADGHMNSAGGTLKSVAVQVSGTDPGMEPITDPAQLASLYTQVGLAAAMSSSKFSGADGQGFAYASGYQLNSAADCSGDGPEGAASDATGISMYPGMEVEEGEDAPDPNVIVAGIKAAPWYLCVTIAEDNAETIPEGNVLMDVTLAADTMIRLVSPAAASMEGIVVASIMHDGTTVQIPYVTTYEGYNQRLVIVNRSKVDAGFTVEFRTEAENADGEPVSVTSDNPTMVMMAPGGQTTILKMTDLVTIENTTRGSATLVVQAGPASVDVATTIVNKGTGATDTIVLD